MTVCRFFQEGRCIYGDGCKYEHSQEKTKQNTFGNQSWIAESSGNTMKPIGLFSAESITKDLTPGQEKPLWPLGSYAPAKYQPLLIPGLDESFEELRVRAVTALKSGTISDYTKYEADKMAAADQMYSNVLANSKQALEQAQQQYVDPEAKSSDSSVFAGNSAGSAFGQPSLFGAESSNISAFGATPAPTSAFGQPAFGQSAFAQAATSPSNMSVLNQSPQTGSVFGQSQPTSAFASQPSSSIIKPASGAFGPSASGGAFSAFAGSGASAFGSGSSPSGGGFSAFASQSSAFGSSNLSAPSGGSVFGQSSFGNIPTAVPAFGAPMQGTTISAFTQPSGFGVQQPAVGSAFGGSAFDSSPNTGSVFSLGASASTNAAGSVFGPGGNASTTAPGNPGSVFGSGGNTSSVFSQNTNSLSPFSQSTSVLAAAPPLQPATSVFGNPSTLSAFSSQPPASSSPSKLQPGPPDFSTAKSTYKPDTDRYDAMLPENYLQLLPQTVKTAFEGSKFEWGKVPEWTPPKELR